MSDKNKRKTILAYAAGIAILALCIAAAWFLPEAYGKWQDKRLIGQVQLSDRQEIDFLDGDVLDQIARWQELEACTDFFWETGEAWNWTVMTHMDELVQACREEADAWRKSGLLPLTEKQINFSENSMFYSETRALLAGENVIPISIFSFSLAEDFLMDDGQNGCITIMLDIETKKAYYMSVVGNNVQEYMAQQLGYASQADMQKKLMENDGQAFSDALDISGMDFAAVCGADEVEVTSYPGMLELDVSLEYDSFQTVAQRRVIAGANYLESVGYPASAAGFGLAVVFGPTANPGIFLEGLYYGDGTEGYWNSVDVLSGTDLFSVVLRDWPSGNDIEQEYFDGM